RRANVRLGDDAKKMTAALSGGDARQALNILEMSVALAEKDENGTSVTTDDVANAVQQRAAYYDKAGDRHYDTISAFIKSVRGSDPDAAVLWLARMLLAGEDPMFVARRLLILASEDIGNADPMGITVAASAAKAVEIVGMPEAKIILAQATTYLATAPKSNASYLAIGRAEALIEKMGDKLRVPLHLRDSSFAAAKDIGYGVGYKYPHDFRGHWTDQDYLPEELSDVLLYKPSGIGHEQEILKRREKIRALKRKAKGDK
ncbi:MAG: replication-associated recombination protein A, partial [Candidatus Coatesbacteria bacterium]